ncbi:MAG TPA: class I SAM-dependent methyltransferase [Longimicrobiales bacterium]|nr:class I SAM-dependent methyltransferase [Longimicrobiales bacterium]
MAAAGPEDLSHGYEAVSHDFITYRTRSAIGADTVRKWAEALPPGGDVLDLGCGPGVPITATLMDLGFRLHGVDASPSMVAEFRARFPEIPIECGSVEHSRFFGRTFDGVVAWGLMFLLSTADQAHLVRTMSALLKPGGRLLFTAPREICTWQDSLTGRESVSLGWEEYRRLLEAERLVEIGEAEDEGDNHYCFARKPT